MPPEPGVKVVCLDGFIARPGFAAKPGELVEVGSQRIADSLITLGRARAPTPEELEGASPQPKPADQSSDRRKSK